MRTRNNTSAVTTPTATSREIGENPTTGEVVYEVGYTNTGQVISDGIDCLIVDELSQTTRFNTCEHHKKVLTPFAAPLSRHFRTESGGIARYYTAAPYALFNRAYVSYGAAVLDYQPTVHLDNWQTMSGAAVNAMLPTFVESNSLVNFILELKDLKRIPDLWNKRRTFVQNVANLHLNYSFGVAPLISDISSIVATLSGFRKKLAALQSGSNRSITRHYRATMPRIDLPAESVAYSEGGSDYEVIGSHSWLRPPVYTATMRFRYQLPDMSLISNQIKALLDSLGVRLNPAIVWNAIHYSFIPDWFVRVGDFLDGLSVDNLPIPVVIEDFCHAVKYSYQNELSSTDFGRRDLVGRSVHSFYTRRRAIPAVGMQSLTEGDPGWRQILLGSSLLVANYTKRKHDNTRKGPKRARFLQLPRFSR